MKILNFDDGLGGLRQGDDLLRYSVHQLLGGESKAFCNLESRSMTCFSPQMMDDVTVSVLARGELQ
jgi:hypothetical protein